MHWAHRVRDRFPDGQLYINLGGYAAGDPVRPVEVLSRFLPALGLPADRVPPDEQEAAALYRSLLADRRMLVVLDNAGTAAQVRPLLPGSPGSLALVTSRDRLAGLMAQDGAHRLTLDVLSPDEASSLLGADRVAEEPGVLTELAWECAHLPLALRIAAANLADHRWQPISEYLAELRGDDRLAALATGDDQAAVRAAFDVSCRALPADVLRLFRLLGVQPGRDIAADAAAALTAAPPGQARRRLDRLAAAHLLTEHEPGRYTFHDLLRVYAAGLAERQDTRAARRDAVARLTDHYLHAADAAARLLYPEVVRLPVPPPARPPVAFGDPADAIAWLDAELPNLVATAQYAARHGPHRVAWLISDTLRYYFVLRRHTVEWRCVAEAALAAARTEGDLAAQAAAELSLASSHMFQSRFPAAIEHANRALGLAGRGGEWQLQAAALNSLGIACTRSGRLPEAIDYYSRSLDSSVRAGWLVGQAICLGNLGVAYRDLGRLHEAVEHHQRALALHRRLDSPGGESKTLESLATAYTHLGRLDEAHQLFDRALALHRQLGDRPGEAEVLRGLAAVHRHAGRLTEAVEPARAALAVARLAGHQNGEIGALNTLGSIRHRLGRHSEAIDDHERALTLSRQAGEPYLEAEALLGLADADQALGRLDRALGRADQAHAVARRCGYRVLEACALSRLAAIHLARGAPGPANELAEQARQIQQTSGYRFGP